MIKKPDAFFASVILFIRQRWMWRASWIPVDRL